MVPHELIVRLCGECRGYGGNEIACVARSTSFYARREPGPTGSGASMGSANRRQLRSRRGRQVLRHQDRSFGIGQHAAAALLASRAQSPARAGRGIRNPRAAGAACSWRHPNAEDYPIVIVMVRQPTAAVSTAHDRV